MTGALYTPAILRLATSVPHLGQLTDAHGQDTRRSPICGSRISVDLCLDAQSRVTAFAQSVHACALGQASACLLGQHIIGSAAQDVAAVAADLKRWLDGNGAIPDWPGLAVFEAARTYPARHAAICLPFEAAAAAAADARVAQQATI